MARMAGQRADTLSGGQQQRVAIARALVQEPEIILADEPIASLDPRNTKVVMDALLHINRHFGITVICNLHSLDLARKYCDRLVGMAGGPHRVRRRAGAAHRRRRARPLRPGSRRVVGRGVRARTSRRPAAAASPSPVPDSTAPSPARRIHVNRRLVLGADPRRRQPRLAGAARAQDWKSPSIPSWCSPWSRPRTPRA